MKSTRSARLRLVAHNGVQTSTAADVQLSPELSARERELALAVYRGDSRVAEQLFDHLIGPIDHAVVRVFSERTEEHEDIVQTSFEQVIVSLGKGSFAGNCSLATWAGRIATHVSLNALRRRIRERKLFEPSSERRDDEQALHEERRMDSRLQLQRVQDVLGRMSRRQSEVLVLHDMQGYQLDEIAALLQITVSAAQSRLVRGRREFLRRIGSPQAGEEKEAP